MTKNSRLAMLNIDSMETFFPIAFKSQYKYLWCILYTHLNSIYIDSKNSFLNKTKNCETNQTFAPSFSHFGKTFWMKLFIIAIK